MPKTTALCAGTKSLCFTVDKRHGRAPPSRESKPYPQTSALTLVQSAATLSVRSAALPGWAIPLGLTLATPALAGQAWVAWRNQMLHLRKEHIKMNINRITIIGFMGKDARHSSTQERASRSCLLRPRSATEMPNASGRRRRSGTAAWRMGLLRSMPPRFNRARLCSWKAKWPIANTNVRSKPKQHR